MLNPNDKHPSILLPSIHHPLDTRCGFVCISMAMAMHDVPTCPSSSFSCGVRTMQSWSSPSITKWHFVYMIRLRSSVTSSILFDPTSGRTASSDPGQRWTLPAAFQSSSPWRWCNKKGIHMCEMTRCSSRSWWISVICRNPYYRTWSIWIKDCPWMFNKDLFKKK